MPVQTEHHEMGSAGQVRIVRACVDDLPKVTALLQAVAADAPHWPESAWRAFVESSTAEGRSGVLLLARAERPDVVGPSDVVGLIAGATVSETAELEYVLVHPRCRGAGVGQRLVQRWLRWAAGQGAREAWLELRASNEPASHLYRRAGFVERGLRPNYYREPQEDALLMWRAVGEVSESTVHGA